MGSNVLLRPFDTAWKPSTTGLDLKLLYRSPSDSDGAGSDDTKRFLLVPCLWRI